MESKITKRCWNHADVKIFSNLLIKDYANAFDCSSFKFSFSNSWQHWQWSVLQAMSMMLVQRTMTKKAKKYMTVCVRIKFQNEKWPMMMMQAANTLPAWKQQLAPTNTTQGWFAALVDCFSSRWNISWSMDSPPGHDELGLTRPRKCSAKKKRSCVFALGGGRLDWFSVSGMWSLGREDLIQQS